MDSHSETPVEATATGSIVPSNSPLSINKEANKVNYQPLDSNGSLQQKVSDGNADLDVDYPSGFRMGAIVVALLLSIFLVCRPSCLVSERPS